MHKVIRFCLPSMQLHWTECLGDHYSDKLDTVMGNNEISLRESSGTLEIVFTP